MLDIHPVLEEGLGNSAYVVELGDDRALVVDPARDPTAYLAVARRRGLRIAYAAETHLHADFLTGSRELAAAGAQLLAPRASRLRYFHRGLEDGQQVDLGGLVLAALATPGHAPEHLAYLLLDGERPLALFSGGALVVGGVARTDLISPGQTEPLARAAYRSLRRLLALPDELAVYPTHGPGSFCSTAAGDRPTTTIGAERRHNRLAGADEGGFAALLQAGLGSYPRYFLGLRERNQHGPPLLGPRWRALAELSDDQVEEQLAAGALLVDARPITRFAAGHIPRALSIALRPQFGTWLGWLVEADRPLVFVLDDHQDRAELVRQCRTVGHDQLVGELAGGMASWRAAGLAEQAVPLVGARQASAGPVVDVRQASEVAGGHLPGAVPIELGALADGLAPTAVPQGPVTVMCGHGERAMTAASLLQRRGHDQVRVLLGSPQDWARATGQSLTGPARPGRQTSAAADADPAARHPVIEVLYVQGCPNYEGALALVERVRNQVDSMAEIRTVLVADQAAAEQARFPGSPTVRVDGRDVEPGSDPATEITLDCRLYRHPHRLAGQPRERWVRDALLQAAGRSPEADW